MLRLLIGSFLTLMMTAASPCSGSFQREWTLHRTANGAHPDGIEQQYLWWMNRARRNPTAEGLFLCNLSDPLVRSRISGFGVDLSLLREEFAATAPRPPAAFDVRLYDAARAHSLDMIERDRQDHLGQSARVAAAGFRTRLHRGNAYAFAETPLEGHAAFNIDWGGSDGTGMQSGRPHRKAIMSIDAVMTNVGIAVVPETDRHTQVGPLVVTGDFEVADESFLDHYNRFLVGTVWTDRNGNGSYDPGEGLAGVTVTPSGGPFYAVTAAGGGYAIPVLAPARMDVTFLGPGAPARTRTAWVGSTSVLIDYVVPEPL
jgi:hypothetical protein